MMSKKMVILGAAGQIARQLTVRLLAETDLHLVLYGRHVNQRLARWAANQNIKFWYIMRVKFTNIHWVVILFYAEQVGEISKESLTSVFIYFTRQNVFHW